MRSTPADAEVLRDAYRFCERGPEPLVPGRVGARRPTRCRRPDDLLRLARSLGTTPSALREDYRRVTRRARRVVERLFYGSS